VGVQLVLQLADSDTEMPQAPLQESWLEPPLAVSHGHPPLAEQRAAIRWPATPPPGPAASAATDRPQRSLKRPARYGGEDEVTQEVRAEGGWASSAAGAAAAAAITAPQGGRAGRAGGPLAPRPPRSRPPSRQAASYTQAAAQQEPAWHPAQQQPAGFQVQQVAAGRGFAFPQPPAPPPAALRPAAPHPAWAPPLAAQQQPAPRPAAPSAADLKLMAALRSTGSTWASPASWQPQHPAAPPRPATPPGGAAPADAAVLTAAVQDALLEAPPTGAAAEEHQHQQPQPQPQLSHHQQQQPRQQQAEVARPEPASADSSPTAAGIAAPLPPVTWEQMQLVLMQLLAAGRSGTG
jgi:hypothetical protein